MKTGDAVAQPPGLSFAGVTKVYPMPGGRELTAVEDVSLQLAPNRIGVLIGPSGCGKSTLLRMVAGLERRTCGEIRLNGRLVDGPGRDRGMVFQSYTSFPWLTVRENVAYGVKINGDSLMLQEGVVEHYLERVKLEHVADAYPHQLSGGMRQRVAIARTLANSPELLLMDEPFGALDPETRWQMQELLLEVVHKERMSVLMVTHDIEEALYLGEDIFFLSSHPGRLEAEIHPQFKQELAGQDRDAMLAHPEYIRLERQIRRMMREQGKSAPADDGEQPLKVLRL
jgi:NitT/TauT family transport system ATP-binding protein